MSPKHYRRFLSKTTQDGVYGCWEWSGRPCTSGYGVMGIDGESILAHRLSYIHHKGEIPSGLCVLHSCDNRMCVNPHHLRVGTVKDNMQDKMRRGRHVVHSGEDNVNAKLTEHAVIDIRRSEDTQTVLARRYGVSQGLISQVKLGKVWKHVSEVA